LQFPRKRTIIRLVKRPKQRFLPAGVIFASLWQGFNHLLWPAVCVNCGDPLSQTGPLCRKCLQELLSSAGPDYCPRCGRDVSPYALTNNACGNCQSTEFHFDQIARAGAYGNALRKMILAFKNGRTELQTLLGSLANAALQASPFAGKIDFFVPVPLHWSKRLIRGYNQSCLLAKSLLSPGCKIDTDLVRIRYTKAQPTMPTPAARERNVAGAFAVRKDHRFAGQNICLVDDVKTTGATLNECARVLKDAGAENVFAIVLAVAGQDAN